MRRIGALSGWLDAAGERSGSDLFQFVTSFFSIPCFKISHFLFKLTYSLQHRHLIRLGRDGARKGGTDFSLHFRDLGSNHGLIAKIECDLRDIKRSLKSGSGAGKSVHINHGDPL